MPSIPRPSFLRPLLQLCAVAVVYALVARVGLLLAIPPGYASGIWPAAGIALGAVLIFGNRVSWGVFLGSFAANLPTALDASSVPTLVGPLITPAVLGMGAMAQALFSAYLVRRYVGFPNPLIRQRDILVFLGLAGPLGCLVACTWSVTYLALSGAVSPEHVLFNWWTWWVGDTIGAVIFAPLCVLAASPSRARLARVALPMGVTLCLAVILFLVAARSERAVLRNEFERKTQAVSQVLIRDLNAYLEMLNAIESFFESVDDVDAEQFRVFVSGFLQRHPGIRSFSWNPTVLADERETFEASRQAGHPGYEITEWDAQKRRIRAPERPLYSVIDYIVPLRGNEAAIGFNTYSEAKRIKALDQARDSGKPVGTGRIVLVQDDAQQAGFILYLPIYRSRTDHSTVDERRENHLGFVGNVYRMSDLVAAALAKTDHADVELAIVDETEPGVPGELYSDRPPDAPSPEVNGYILTREIPYEMASRKWVLHFYSKPDAWMAHRSWQGWAVLAVGFLFSGLIGAFMLIVSGHSEDTEMKVVERTEALRASEARFRSVTEAANDAIVVINEEGLILSWNRAAERMFGYSTTEAVWKPLAMVMASRYRSDYDAALTQYWAAGEAPMIGETVELAGLRKDGTEFPFEISLAGWTTDQGRFVGGIIRDITRRKQVEAELKSNEEQLRMLVGSVRDYAILMLDANGHVATWNTGAELLKGYRSDEIIGEHFSKFYPEAARKAQKPERLLEIVRREGSFEDEGWRVRKDGTHFWANVLVSAVYGNDGQLLGYSKVTRDLSERRRAAQEVRESRERLDLAIESARMAVWDLDLKKDKVIRSLRYDQLFGYEQPREEWTRETLLAHVHPEDRDKVRKQFERAFESNVLTGEFRVHWPDGTTHWLRSEGRVFRDEDGTPLRMVGVIWETTELRELQHQLEERNAALEIETQRAQEASRLKSEFLANMSHELRTPLNGVIGFTEFLVDGKAGPLNASQTEFLNDVLNSARHLLNLINDILDLAKIEAGRMDLLPEPMSLRETIEEVAHNFDVVTQKRRIVFEREITTEVDGRYLDRQKFCQVLYNLLSNAVKFTPEGGRVTLQVRDLPDTGLEIRVRDTGIGIAEADMNRLFVQFQQLDASATRRFQGTGLGLALTKKLVDLHQGSIRVDSKLGEGSTFTVTFPKAPFLPNP